MGTGNQYRTNEICCIRSMLMVNMRTIGSCLAGLALFISFGALAGCAVSPGAGLKIMTDDIAGLPADLWQDSKDYVQRPENAIVLIAGGAASGYYSVDEDDRVAKHFEGRHTFPRDLTIAMGMIPATEAVVAGVGYLHGVYTDQQESRDVWWSVLEAESLQALYWLALKGAANNHSPNGENFAWPSGHTSTAVTFATVLNEYYGPVVGVPLYALSGLVMYERMETKEHWASDVIFGAAIGFTVGRTVAGKHKPEIFGMEVVPYFNPERGSSGIGLAKRF